MLAHGLCGRSRLFKGVIGPLPKLASPPLPLAALLLLVMRVFLMMTLAHAPLLLLPPVSSVASLGAWHSSCISGSTPTDRSQASLARSPATMLVSTCRGHTTRRVGEVCTEGSGILRCVH